MVKYVIEKSGPLTGEVVISGSKNAVLPVLAATILAESPCEIIDAPHLSDVEVMCKILTSVGAKVDADWKNHTIAVDPTRITRSELPYDLVKMMRASIFVMGPLLAKTGRAVIAHPGGCSIGSRPIDLHIKGLRMMGAKIIDDELCVDAKANELFGNLIYLDFPSVGATENIMMAASLARGTTVIENAAQEPEIVDLANFLNQMGAKIKGAGTDTIRVEGVDSLHGAKHAVIPDRIETGTFMVAAAMTRGDLLIKNCMPSHVKPIIAKLAECGAVVNDEVDGLRVRGDIKNLIATSIKTMPYPGFPTDMQAPFMALLTTVKGESKVYETVFENRLLHVEEFNKLGAGIKVFGQTAVVPGNFSRLTGAKVTATDLRAGSALVLAGLMADGTTEVGDIFHIERGYENFVEKLCSIGAKVRRSEE